MEIEVLEGVFDANEMVAEDNRVLLDERGAFMVNLMASPGAGKTSFIMKTLEGLAGEIKAAVIEGDIAGKVDSERIAATGVPAIQINTGGSCHLEARQINTALNRLDLEGVRLVIVENVGNLVCPAEFKLGEDMKVMILSVAEGDDKPLKYPLMFSESHVLIINKIDLLLYTDFDMGRLEETVRKMNPAVEMFKVSCRTGEGLDAWTEWLKECVKSSSGPGGDVD
jgi:hydrogenase nickel incorporation protein HypB